MKLYSTVLVWLAVAPFACARMVMFRFDRFNPAKEQLKFTKDNVTMTIGNATSETGTIGTGTYSNLCIGGEACSNLTHLEFQFDVPVKLVAYRGRVGHNPNPSTKCEKGPPCYSCYSCSVEFTASAVGQISQSRQGDDQFAGYTFSYFNNPFTVEAQQNVMVRIQQAEQAGKINSAHIEFLIVETLDDEKEAIFLFDEDEKIGTNLTISKTQNGVTFSATYQGSTYSGDGSGLVLVDGETGIDSLQLSFDKTITLKRFLVGYNSLGSNDASATTGLSFFSAGGVSNDIVFCSHSLCQSTDYDFQHFSNQFLVNSSTPIYVTTNATTGIAHDELSVMAIVVGLEDGSFPPSMLPTPLATSPPTAMPVAPMPPVNTTAPTQAPIPPVNTTAPTPAAIVTNTTSPVATTLSPTLAPTSEHNTLFQSINWTALANSDCFSGVTLVEVRNGGIRPMSHVRIGDVVRTSHTGFSRVYSMGHLDDETPAEFLQIFSSSLSSSRSVTNPPLEVTKSHMVFVEGQPRRAMDIKVGDKLGMMQGETTVVTSIQIVTRQGVYAPVTESGTIVVSGVLASCYVAPFDDLSSHFQHVAAQAILSPLRLLACSTTTTSTSTAFAPCPEETYVNGRPLYIWNLMDYGRRLEGLSRAIQFPVLAIATLVLVSCNIVENLFFLSAKQVLILLLVVLGGVTSRRQSKTVKQL